MTDVVEESDAGLVRGWGGPECCHRHDGARSGLEPSGFMFSATLVRVNWLCNCICILYVVHTVRRNKHDVFLEKDFVEWAWGLRLKTNPSLSAVSCWRRDGVKGWRHFSLASLLEDLCGRLDVNIWRLKREKTVTERTVFVWAADVTGTML